MPTRFQMRRERIDNRCTQSAEFLRSASETAVQTFVQAAHALKTRASFGGNPTGKLYFLSEIRSLYEPFEGQNMTDIATASTQAQLEEVRTLIREFSEWALETFFANDAEIPPAFRNLEDELANLPGKYAEPDGVLLLAIADGRSVGCLLGFRHDEHSMEVSRLWVRPEGRGRGVGAALVKHAQERAQLSGYRRIVLRSHSEMRAAHDVYRASGFEDVDGPSVFPEIRDIALAMQYSLD